MQAIFGGNIFALYRDVRSRARGEAFNLMIQHAGEMGAECASCGVRYDATEIAPGITEVLCYGTAVFCGESLKKRGRRNAERGKKTKFEVRIQKNPKQKNRQS